MKRRPASSFEFETHKDITEQEFEKIMSIARQQCRKWAPAYWTVGEAVAFTFGYFLALCDELSLIKDSMANGNFVRNGLFVATLAAACPGCGSLVDEEIEIYGGDRWHPGCLIEAMGGGQKNVKNC